jgi:hypothetical protein
MQAIQRRKHKNGQTFIAEILNTGLALRKIDARIESQFGLSL